MERSYWFQCYPSSTLTVVSSGNERDLFQLPHGPPRQQILGGSSRRTQPRQAGRSIRGPMLLAWLKPALMMPGLSPVMVALAPAFQSRGERLCRIRIARKLFKRFQIAPRTCHDALNKLVSAAAMRVHKLPGRCQEVERRNYVSRDRQHESDLADRDFIVPGNNRGQNSHTQKANLIINFQLDCTPSGLEV